MAIFCFDCEDDDFVCPVCLTAWAIILTIVMCFVPIHCFTSMTLRGRGGQKVSVTMTLSVLNSVWRCPLNHNHMYIFIQHGSIRTMCPYIETQPNSYMQAVIQQAIMSCTNKAVW